MTHPAGLILGAALLVLGAAVAESPARPAASPAESPEGCWNTVIELPWPVGKKKGELCLEHENGTWSGKYFLRKKWRTLESIKVDGNALAFSVGTPVGTAKFDLTYSANSMKGTADGKFGERPFTGSRK